MRIISPPSLSIVFPDNNFVTQEKVIKIQGYTEPETGIKINGDSVIVDHNGFFSKEINLKKGLNNVTIIATKKYSRPTKITRQIFVKD